MGGLSLVRLRLAGGLTLLVLSVAFAAFAVWANSVQGDGSLGPLFAILTMAVFVGPTILAAIGLLAGGTLGAIVGGLISWSCFAILAWIFAGSRSDGAGALLGVVLVAAYGFVGLVAFKTVHARDKPHMGAAA